MSGRAALVQPCFHQRLVRGHLTMLGIILLAFLSNVRPRDNSSSFNLLVELDENKRHHFVMAGNLGQREPLVRLRASKPSKATEHSAKQEGSGTAM